ncbi:MAG: leucine-rich repeat domain-containing protein [Lachnospiraceae bacterium]|nr:leucine-rich repeat domain-containing protein [Lachnospiraceae bacterium]
MSYRYIKKYLCLALAGVMLAGSAVQETALAAYAQEIQSPKLMDADNTLKDPVITMNNLTLQAGNTAYLTDNPSGKDMDFYTGGSTMSDAYIEYNFIDVVQVSSILMIGWWPKDQGIREMSVTYWEAGEWKSALERTELPWKTVSGNGSSAESPHGEILSVQLPKSVETTKLRIQIHSTYYAWGKMNMRLLAPQGRVIRNIRGLYNEIEKAKSYLDSVLLGGNPGEYPQAAADTLSQRIAEISPKAEDPDISEEDLSALIQEMQEAIRLFEQSQNPVTAATGLPSVTLENLSTAEGSPSLLTDRQLNTGLKLTHTDESLNGEILFDFGSRSIHMESLTLISDEPKHAPQALEVQAFLDGTWETVAQEELIWKDTIPNFEGKEISLAQIVTAQKFRVLIQNNMESDFCKINEITLNGNTAVQTDQLQSLIQKGEDLLSANAELRNILTDQLSFKLNRAKNSEYIALVSQEEIEQLYSDLNETITLLESSLKPEPNASALDEAVAKAQKLNSGDYTQESFARVTRALEKALKADRLDQTAMDLAVKELNEAIAALQKKQDPPIKDIPVVESKLPAVNSIYKDKNFVYKVKKNFETAIVRPIKKTRTTVTIPKTVNINGYTLKVTGIQNNAFKNNTKLKTINCGSNVKSIGSCAFMGCKNLKKVVIGAKVTTIGAKAFYKDKKLKTLTIKTTKLKKAGKSAFKGISPRASIKVPKKNIQKYRRLLKKSGLSKTVKIK